MSCKTARFRLQVEAKANRNLFGASRTHKTARFPHAIGNADKAIGAERAGVDRIAAAFELNAVRRLVVLECDAHRLIETGELGDEPRLKLVGA